MELIDGDMLWRWYNFASDDGALADTKVAFSDLEKYKQFYGHLLDRIGDEDGRYLKVMEDGKSASWEERAMHIDSLGKPLHTYSIDSFRRIGKLKCRKLSQP